MAPRYKAYKLAVFEISGDFLQCHILQVHAIPTLESTNCMIGTNIFGLCGLKTMVNYTLKSIG